MHREMHWKAELQHFGFRTYYVVEKYDTLRAYFDCSTGTLYNTKQWVTLQEFLWKLS